MEALESRGFDRDGKRMVNSVKEDGKRGGEAHNPVMQAVRRVDEPKNLTGTLRIQSNPIILTAKFDAVKQEAGQLVDELVRIIRKRDKQRTSEKWGSLHNGHCSSNQRRELKQDSRDPRRYKSATRPSKSNIH